MCEDSFGTWDRKSKDDSVSKQYHGFPWKHATIGREVLLVFCFVLSVTKGIQAG